MAEWQHQLPPMPGGGGYGGHVPGGGGYGGPMPRGGYWPPPAAQMGMYPPPYYGQPMPGPHARWGRPGGAGTAVGPSGPWDPRAARGMALPTPEEDTDMWLEDPTGGGMGAGPWGSMADYAGQRSRSASAAMGDGRMPGAGAGPYPHAGMAQGRGVGSASFTMGAPPPQLLQQHYSGPSFPPHGPAYPHPAGPFLGQHPSGGISQDADPGPAGPGPSPWRAQQAPQRRAASAMGVPVRSTSWGDLSKVAGQRAGGWTESLPMRRSRSYSNELEAVAAAMAGASISPLGSPSGTHPPPEAATGSQG